MTTTGPAPAPWQTPTIEPLTSSEATADVTAPVRNGFQSSVPF